MKRSLYFQVKESDLAQLVIAALQDASPEKCIIQCHAGVDESHPGGYTLVALRDVENSEGVLLIRNIRAIEKAWSEKKIEAVKAKMRQEDPQIDFGKLTKEQLQGLVVETISAPSRLAHECVEAWDFSKMKVA